MANYIDQLDVQSMRALRVCLIGRMNLIDSLYPHDGNKQAERTQALEDLIHLAHELGLDSEELFGY